MWIDDKNDVVEKRFLAVTLLFEGVFANQQPKSTVFANSNKASAVDALATITTAFSGANVMWE